jgi:hypothetical protein
MTHFEMRRAPREDVLIGNLFAGDKPEVSARRVEGVGINPRLAGAWASEAGLAHESYICMGKRASDVPLG